jgi:YHS domain-containing protein
LAFDRKLAFILVLLAAALLSILPGAAISGAQSPVPALNATAGVAVKGYDPVAYFTAGEPTPGTEDHTFRWQGVTYRFASADNLRRFEANPEIYLPQYGGYCAYAMSINRIADIDPTRWAIVDKKLYLNNNLFSQTLWLVNNKRRIAAADQNWKKFPKTVTEAPGTR